MYLHRNCLFSLASSLLYSSKTTQILQIGNTHEKPTQSAIARFLNMLRLQYTKVLNPNTLKPAIIFYLLTSEDSLNT